MIKKIVSLIMMVLIALSVVSCSNNTINEKTNSNTVQSPTKQQNETGTVNSDNLTLTDSNNESYEIIKENYSGNNKIIKIAYPQIINYKDAMKQAKLNELIKNESLKFFKEISNDKDIVLTAFELDYIVELKTNNTLSIKYTGYQNTKGAAHPNHMFLSSNIDIKQGSLIKLGDIIKIDNEFVKLFKSGKFKSISAVYQKGYLEELSDEELIRTFKESQFYLKADSLGISVEVPYAMGNHVEFEAKYQDINDIIIKENEVWKQIINKKE